MTPVISSLQQHVCAATASEPVSPDDASFRQEMLPRLSGGPLQLQNPKHLHHPSRTTTDASMQLLCLNSTKHMQH
jgi:hypothetical protein